MVYTIVPIIREAPLTMGALHLPVDLQESVAWMKALQSIHPRLLPQIKESALLSEEESAFCVAGGVYEYERGVEWEADGEQYRLSHCAEHFLDFLLESKECLSIVEEKSAELAKVNGTDAQLENFAAICDWWRQGWRVLILQH